MPNLIDVNVSVNYVVNRNLTLGIHIVALHVLNDPDVVGLHQCIMVIGWLK